MEELAGCLKNNTGLKGQNGEAVAELAQHCAMGVKDTFWTSRGPTGMDTESRGIRIHLPGDKLLRWGDALNLSPKWRGPAFIWIEQIELDVIPGMLVNLKAPVSAFVTNDGVMYVIKV